MPGPTPGKRTQGRNKPPSFMDTSRRTHRQSLMEILADGPYTLNDLSERVHLPIKDVLHHLTHVRRSIRPPQRFIMEPAQCLTCGFVFKERRKLSPPSKCPKCKSSHIQDPRYRTEKRLGGKKSSPLILTLFLCAVLLAGPAVAAQHPTWPNPEPAAVSPDAGMSFQELYVRGTVHYATGRYEQAIPFMAACVKKKPTDEKAWYILGYCYKEESRLKEASHALRQALRLRPDFEKAHRVLALVYRRQGYHEAALGTYRAILRLSPQDGEIHYEIGRLYAVLNRHREAVAAFEKALGLMPDEARVCHELGISYRELGFFNKEIGVYRRILSLDPEDGTAHFHLGAAYLKLGRYAEAVEALQRAVQLKPNFTLAHYIMGWAHLLNGERGMALGQYRILSGIDPPVAAKLLEQIQAEP